MSVLSINKLRPQSECATPDSCIHCVVLDIEHPTATGKRAISEKYMQKKQLPDVYLHDEFGSGVDVKVDLASKGCVKNNPSCPSGKLASKDAELSFDITAGVNKYHLSSADFFETYSSHMNFIFFLDSCILGSFKYIPRTTYFLSISECRGNSSLTELYDYFEPVSSFFFPQPKATVATKNKIVIYPKFEWESLLSLDFAKLIKKSTHCSVTLSGTNSLTIGGKKEEFTTQLAERHIKRYGADSKFLKKIKSVKKLKNDFAKQGGTSDFPIVDLSFVPPTVEMSGKGALIFSKQNYPYIQRDLTVKLKNLLNFELKVDLLQAVAARYKFENQIAEIRAKQKAFEEKIKNEGKNGAYAGTEFDLFFKVEISVSCTITSSKDKLWDVSLTPLPTKNKEKQATLSPSGSVDGEVSIGARVGLRLGAKFTVLDGYYKGEMHLEGKATIAATGCFSISPHNAGGCELVLFHNGIWAEVLMQVETTFSAKTASEETNRTSRAEKLCKQSPSKSTIDSKHKKTSRWQIYTPCPKDSSQCRIHFFSTPSSEINNKDYWNSTNRLMAL